MEHESYDNMERESCDDMEREPCDHVELERYQTKLLSQTKKLACFTLLAPFVAIAQRNFFALIPYLPIQPISVLFAWAILIAGLFFGILGIAGAMKINGSSGIKLFVMSVIGVILNSACCGFGVYLIVRYMNAIHGM